MEIISDKIVITRKSHICSACLRTFDKGTRMRRQVNTYDGIQQWYECSTCRELLSTHREHFEDEYGWCESGCVKEVAEIGQTPEQLLEYFNKKAMSNKEKVIAEEFLKGCEHDGSFVPVKEVIRLMEEYAALCAEPVGEEEKDLFNLIKTALKHGYNSYEIVEAGLESFDVDIEADWILKKYLKQQKS